MWRSAISGAALAAYARGLIGHPPRPPWGRNNRLRKGFERLGAFTTCHGELGCSPSPGSVCCTGLSYDRRKLSEWRRYPSAVGSRAGGFWRGSRKPIIGQSRYLAKIALLAGMQRFLIFFLYSVLRNWHQPTSPKRSRSACDERLDAFSHVRPIFLLSLAPNRHIEGQDSRVSLRDGNQSTEFFLALFDGGLLFPRHA